MALADPQSITPDGGSAVSLPRIQDDGLKSIYQSSDGLTRLIVSHQEGKKRNVATMVRLEKDVLVADPGASSTAPDVKVTLSCWMVIDRPAFGFTNAEIEDYALGLLAKMNNSSLIQALLGEQH